MLTAVGPTEETYSVLKIAALLIFFAAFMFILLRLIFSSRAKYDRAARIPLEDNDDPTTREPKP